MIAWDIYFEACCRLGWTPREFWDATLTEIETAIWVAIKPNLPKDPLTDDQVRQLLSGG